MSRAAGWLEKQLVASGPPALSRAVAHIIMSSFCPQEKQQASGSLETPESKGQPLAVRVWRCFFGEGFFISFIELQLLCLFVFFHASFTDIWVFKLLKPDFFFHGKDSPPPFQTKTT